MAGVDAKNCSASGEGLLAATAGVEASFRVMCRSTQGELMDLPDDGRELTIKFTERGRRGNSGDMSGGRSRGTLTREGNTSWREVSQNFKPLNPKAQSLEPKAYTLNPDLALARLALKHDLLTDMQWLIAAGNAEQV